MEASSVSTWIKSEPGFIKLEPGIRVKSEFEPSLSSLPMAPVKKEEFKLDVKPDVKQGTPTQSKPNTSRRSTRRRYGPGFIRHRDGPYDFRAHYGHGRVEFTVTYNPLNEGRPWGKLCDAVDTVFVRLRNAHFNIEPAEEPARWLRDQYWLARFESVRFSLDVRQIRAPVKQPKSAGAGSQVCKAEKDEQKDDKTKLTFLTFVPSTANGKQEVSCPVDTKNYGDLLPSSVSPPAGLEQENMLPSDVKKDDMEFGLVPSSPIIKQESDLKFGF